MIRVRLSVPAPTEPRYNLVRTATVVNEADDRWGAGAALEGYITPSIQTASDVCGPQAARTYANPAAGGDFNAFSVLMGAKCTSRSVGNYDEFRRRLVALFRAVESKGAEAELERGAALTTPNNNPALINNPTLVSGTTATNPTNALALLEQAIADVGIAGMIHASVRVATMWQRLNLLTPDGSGATATLRTGLGTPVVPGRGYTGAQPVDAGGAAQGAANTALIEWAYASGPVEIRRQANEETLIPDLQRAMARRTNDVFADVSRLYLVTWDQSVHAAVRIDRSL